MRIDSHQHFWRYDPREYPWIRHDWPIRRDFLPPDLLPALTAARLDGSIAVQARQSVEETRWLLQLARENRSILGVVGWIDLRSPQVREQLEEFRHDPLLVGLRHVVQDEPDDAFMVRDDFLRGIAALAGSGLVYDLLVFPRQLPAAIELVRRHPAQPFVLDHLAKPAIKEGIFHPWEEQLRALARHPNVACKISGFMTEAAWNNWSPSDFNRCFEVVWEAFGPDRLLFGSDWPVCLLSGSHAQAVQLVEDWIPHAARERVLGENAGRIYRVPSQKRNSGESPLQEGAQR